MPSSYLKGISTITGKPESSFDEKVALVRFAYNYLKGNIIPRKAEGAWFDRKQGDEGIYAEPNYNMLQGEVTPPALKGAQVFSKGKKAALSGRLLEREKQLQKVESGADTFFRHIDETNEIADALNIPSVEANRIKGAIKQGYLTESDVRPIIERVAKKDGSINLSDLTKKEYMELFGSYGGEGWRTMMGKRYDRLNK